MAKAAFCPPKTRVALVVDDDEDSRVLARIVLRRAGYAVTAVENGRVAVAQLRDTAPDLIVLDLDMPEMDGFGLLQYLSASATFDAIPVVLYSAAPNLPSIAHRLGVAGYVAKGTSDQVRAMDRLLRQIEVDYADRLPIV